MPRDGAQARARLREAALDLYRERGYDETAAAQIAARAGVIERTYFATSPTSAGCSSTVRRSYV
jgi:Bacterial regulatory proteins, tetR family